MTKRELQQQIDSLSRNIERTFARIDRLDASSGKRITNIKKIEESVERQDEIINLILKELKKEVVEEDSVEEEFDGYAGGVFSTMKITPIFKKVIKTRLKLIKAKK